VVDIKTTELRLIDRRLVVSRLPEDVYGLMKLHKLYLAGGFIRAMLGEGRASDIDLFGPGGVDAMRPIAQALADDRDGSVVETERAITVIKLGMLPVQFVTGFPTDDPAALVSQFDFTIAQVAIWSDGDNWQSITSVDFYPDLAARRLVYTGKNALADVGGSILRMRKFLTAGYSIQVPSLARLVARMSLNVKQFAEAAIDEDRVVDVIEGLLREVDPNVVAAEASHE
jgi:hypothetical protein